MINVYYIIIHVKDYKVELNFLMSDIYPYIAEHTPHRPRPSSRARLHTFTTTFAPARAHLHPHAHGHACVRTRACAHVRAHTSAALRR